MDLKTIKARIKDGVIRTSVDFQRDVYLMFANAMMYNRPGSDIALMAEEVAISPLELFEVMLKLLSPDDARERGPYQCFPADRRLLAQHPHMNFGKHKDNHWSTQGFLHVYSWALFAHQGYLVQGSLPQTLNVLCLLVHVHV